MNTPEEKSPEPVSPEGRDLSIKFTLIFGLFAFIPLVLMYHFMSAAANGARARRLWIMTMTAIWICLFVIM
jgi:hypothetical protein